MNVVSQSQLFSDFRGFFEPFGCEVERVRLATRRATDDDYPPRLQRAQAMADVALLTSQGLANLAKFFVTSVRK